MTTELEQHVPRANAAVEAAALRDLSDHDSLGLAAEHPRDFRNPIVVIEASDSRGRERTPATLLHQKVRIRPGIARAAPRIVRAIGSMCRRSTETSVGVRYGRSGSSNAIAVAPLPMSIAAPGVPVNAATGRLRRSAIRSHSKTGRGRRSPVTRRRSIDAAAPRTAPFAFHDGRKIGLAI